jgi:alpha-D-ribose 1-methylphosphonate 5-triphosphate synthase subunit PhnH
MSFARADRGTAVESPASVFDPVHDTQRTFRVLLDAMARPGQIHQLPVAVPGAPGNGWLAAALLTLLDHEVALAVEPLDGSDGEAATALARFVRQRTNAKLGPADAANFVVAAWSALDPDLPRRLRVGSPAYPDDSATLLLLVDGFDALDHSVQLDLTGPGISDVRTLALGGVPAAFFDALADIVDYPCGLDLLLVDAAGRVAALPRSTRITLRATVGAGARGDA